MKNSRGRHLTLTSNLSTCMPGCASYSCACIVYTYTYSISVDLLCSLDFTERQEYLFQSVPSYVQPLAGGYSELRGTGSS